MSGIYPLTELPRDVKITSHTQTYASVSQNLSVETRTRGIQRWQIVFEYPPLTRDEASGLSAFIISQQGSFDTFTLVLPSPLNLTRGTQVDNVPAEGVPMVTDLNANLSRSVQVGNFNKSATAALKAGDFFKFSNHDKLYMVTVDLVTDANGRGDLQFTPPVISTLAAGADPDNDQEFENGTTIIHGNPSMTVSLMDDDFTMPMDENVFYSLSVRMAERVSATNIVSP